MCGRRAAYLIKKGDHVNLGIGMPESVSDVAAEEGFSDDITMSVECGIFGGVPLGGFINITQSTQNVAFVGTFTAGGCKFEIGGGKLKIAQEGRAIKFKKQVEQITFSGEYAAETGKNILYITERAVFQLVPGGIKLIEIAPGVDLEKDILAHMEFKPLIAEDLKEMDACLFTEGPMGMTK